MFGLLSKFGLVKVKDVKKGIIEGLTRLDPKGMSEAELLKLEADLDKVGLEVTKLRADVEKERREKDGAAENLERLKKAGRHLKEKMAAAEAAGNQGELSKLEAQAVELAGRIKTANADFERENQEFLEIEAELRDVETFYNERVTALKGAKAALASAQREMESAARAKARAQEQAERQMRLNGLRDEDDGIGSAVAAMKRNAEKDRQVAEAAKLKTSAFKKDEGSSELDALIADANSNQTPKPSGRNALDGLLD